MKHLIITGLLFLSPLEASAQEPNFCKGLDWNTSSPETKMAMARYFAHKTKDNMPEMDMKCLKSMEAKMVAAIDKECTDGEMGQSEFANSLFISFYSCAK